MLTVASRRFAPAVLLCALVFAASVAAQEVLTNDSVIAMKKAGLSESIILAKIRSSQAKFDVSTQSLVGLKQAGLSDAVIEAMVSHGSGGTTAPAARGAAPSAPAPAASQAIFHVKGGQVVEITPAVASIETNMEFFSSKSELVLKGRRASYRVVEKQPVFLSAWAPNEVPLVRLKPGDKHDDRNLKFSGGAFMPYGGTQTTGIRKEDVIEVDSERDARGLYRLKPKEPLKSGEYGFVVTQAFGPGGGKIYDFGVE
ncbi:MAG TPA: hypothetical protein VHZ49_06930 [Methylomirabilota bacterium]|jgi:hypothetical protein|nr:hypothetical protein [Methylomirabilota bacterium]